MANIGFEKSEDEAFILLIVETATHEDQVHVKRWELALATEREIIDKDAMRIHHPDEEVKLLEVVSRRLDQLKGEAGVIITPSENEIEILKERIQSVVPEAPDIEAYRLQSVESILDHVASELFDQDASRDPTATAWSDWSSIRTDEQIRQDREVKRCLDVMIPEFLGDDDTDLLEDEQGR